MKEGGTQGLYEATAPLLNVFQTAAVLEVQFLGPVLEIRSGNRDNLGRISHISPLKHML